MINGMLCRLKLLVSRNWRARALGIKFVRAKSFDSLPSKVRIAGREIQLQAPNEMGVRTAFVDVLLDDCYGLRQGRGAECRTILDVGANVGLFALAARDAFPRATIHCYEPNAANFEYLHANAAQVQAVCHDEAVGLEEGQAILIVNNDSVQVRALPSQDGDISQVAFARAVERIGGHCDLVKLDCEGAEWAILKDSSSWQCVDRLAMEYHLLASDFQHDDIATILKSIGFRVVRQFVDHRDFGRVWAMRSSMGC